MGPKLLYYVIFGLKFQKTILIFEIGNFDLVQLLNFVKKQKRLNLGPKMPYLGVFGLELFLKNYCDISNQHP